MADQPCLGSVDFPTLASCDPRNHYLAWPLPVWRPPNPPCWLANTPFCWWLAGCATAFVQLCAILCQSGLRPSEVVVTYLWVARCMEESARAPAATYYRMGNRL